jgi:hypothetical protein
MAVDGAMLSEKIDGKSELSAASVSPALGGVFYCSAKLCEAKTIFELVT